MSQPLISTVRQWYSTLRSSYVQHHNRRRFQRIVRTPAMKTHPQAPATLCTLTCHRDVLMYLVAIKSFLTFYRDVAVMVFDDGTLTRADRRLLEQHIQGIGLYALPGPDDPLDRHVASDRNVGKLQGVLRYARTHKILLMDSDVIFLKEPTEVLRWIVEGTAVRWYAQDLSEHHNSKGELKQAFGVSAFPPYFNAGFVGLFREDLVKDEVRHILEVVAGLPTVKFKEQAAWCVLLGRKAIAPLSERRYVTCGFRSGTARGGGVVDGQPCFLHFVSGKTHAVNSLYVSCARRVINGLGSPSVPGRGAAASERADSG